ncbi:MAG: cytochrome C [Desulfobacteraceae bacterium]|nr:MAG: cytochrome C [Desulfobacteraceae bacterium]
MFVVAVLSLMIAAGIYAATVPDVIEMLAPYEHTKGPVTFTHKKHVDDYKIACGDCHHDDKGQPLTALKTGDPVKKCFDCHSKPGEIKGKEAKGLSDKDKRAYHANAVHDNCIDCHKKFNKGKDPKPAPQVCKDCHPKG